MKIIAMSLFISFLTYAAPSETKRILPVLKEQELVKKEKKSHEKLQEIIGEEDCDEKAKKPIEIKPESISLSGSVGCTLE